LFIRENFCALILILHAFMTKLSNITPIMRHDIIHANWMQTHVLKPRLKLNQRDEIKEI